MQWWNSSGGQPRQFEDKSIREYETDKVRNRMNIVHSAKQSLKLIGLGLVFVVILTGIDYGLKNPEITGNLRRVLQVGFIISILGSMYVPYGVYNFILSFGRKK